MARSAISGKAMAINSDAGSGVTGWKITRKHYPVATVGSNMQSGTDRGLGNIDWTGEFVGNGYLPTVFPGDSFTFTAAPASGSEAVSGTARCLLVQITVDNRNPEQPQPIRHRVLFGANGALSTGQSAPTDSSTPSIYGPKGLCAYFSVAQTRTVYQRLTIYLRNYRRLGYVDCTTDGQFYRTSSEIDARFDWAVYTDMSSDWPNMDSPRAVARMYVTADLYWELQWMNMVDCPDPWEVDRITAGHPVMATFAAEFDGHDGTSIGHINTPEESPTTKWPA